MKLCEVEDLWDRLLSKELLLFETDSSQRDLVNALILINDLLFLLELVSRDLVLGDDVEGRLAIAFLDLLLHDGLLCCELVEELLLLLLLDLLLADGVRVLVGVWIGHGLHLRLLLLLLLLLLGFACRLLTLLLRKFSCLDQALPLSGLLQIGLLPRIILLFFEFLLGSGGCFGAEFL